MTDAPDEREAARELLADHIFTAVQAAAAASPTPQLVLGSVPIVLAGIAGSYVLQLLRARILGDGDVDAILADMAATMRDHADPSLPGNDGQHVQLSDQMRRLLRGAIRG